MTKGSPLTQDERNNLEHHTVAGYILLCYYLKNTDSVSDRAIATEMKLPQEKIDGIRMADSIHDIGKLSIPAEILSKLGKLSELVFSMVKEHSRKGYEMLKAVESP